MTLIIVLILTLIILFLINSDDEDKKGKIIANAIALADMGLLAWLLC